MTSLEMAQAAAHALDSKRAQDIKVLKVRDITVIADYFVIAAGESGTQVKAAADEVDYALGQLGAKPIRRDGDSSSGWIVLDYGNVIVHVFYTQQRDFYKLERLWADAQPVEIQGINE